MKGLYLLGITVVYNFAGVPVNVLNYSLNKAVNQQVQNIAFQALSFSMNEFVLDDLIRDEE